MQNKVKLLLKLNLIAYITAFVGSVFVAFFPIEENHSIEYAIICAIWSLSPFVFLTLTSFVLATDNDRRFKIFKKQARIDYAIRLISYLIIFALPSIYKIKPFSTEFFIQHGIVLTLFIINLILEYKMYKVASIDIQVVKKETKEITEDEKKRRLTIGRAVSYGTYPYYIYFLLMGGLIALSSSNKDFTVKNVFFIFALIANFVWFCLCTYKKCSLYYADKNKATEVFKKDITYAIIGFIIFLVLLFVLPTKIPNVDVKMSLMFMQILFMYPTIKTSRKMALRYKEILKSS